MNSWEPHAYRHAEDARPTFVLAVYLDPRAGFALGASGGTMRFAASCMPVTRAVRSPAEAIVRELDRFASCDPHAVDEGLRALLEAAPTEWGSAPAGAAAPPRRHAAPRPARRPLHGVHERASGRAGGLARARGALRAVAPAPLSPFPAIHAAHAGDVLEHAANGVCRHPSCAPRRVGRPPRAGPGVLRPGNFTRFFHAIQGMAPSDYHAAALGTSRPASTAAP